MGWLAIVAKMMKLDNKVDDPKIHRKSGGPKDAQENLTKMRTQIFVLHKAVAKLESKIENLEKVK